MRVVYAWCACGVQLVALSYLCVCACGVVCVVYVYVCTMLLMVSVCLLDQLVPSLSKAQIEREKQGVYVYHVSGVLSLDVVYFVSPGLTKHVLGKFF